MNRRVLAAALCTALLASADHGRCQTSSGPPTVKILSTTTFDWNGGPQGWEGTVDFKLDSAFNKLGGHLSGNAWVTESPRYPRTYTSGATADTEGYPARYPGPNLLISPWLDLSGLDDTSIVLSFQQSIDVEPG